MVKTATLDIFTCPFCAKSTRKKLKLFKKIQNLNIHITKAHESKYKIVIVNSPTRAKLCLK